MFLTPSIMEHSTIGHQTLLATSVVYLFARRQQHPARNACDSTKPSLSPRKMYFCTAPYPGILSIHTIYAVV